jgi:catechol 2,3-dioxygenase-like lactoylglutathione lyase family enzyme
VEGIAFVMDKSVSCRGVPRHPGTPGSFPGSASGFEHVGSGGWDRVGVHGRLHHVILDSAEPRALAEFWSALLGQPITYDSLDFVVVSADDTTSGLAFQRAPDHRAPTWPDPAVPQQIHLDVMVEDVAEATPVVLALGATRLDDDGVFADPAGHPFCLIPRPAWAAPLPD